MFRYVALKIAMLLLFIVATLVLLGQKYITIGDCATIVYYKPISYSEIALLSLLGIVILSLSIFFSYKNNKATPQQFILELCAYMLIVLTVALFGNDILGLRKEYWPNEYKVQPL